MGHLLKGAGDPPNHMNRHVRVVKDNITKIYHVQFWELDTMVAIVPIRDWNNLAVTIQAWMLEGTIIP